MNPHHSLLVDDDPVVQLVVSQYLRNLGFGVETAGTLREAFNRLETSAPHLILLDLFLAEGESTPLLRHISSLAAPQPLVVMMTALDTVEAIIGDSAPPAAVLQKPFSQSDLEVCLRSIGTLREPAPRT